MPGTMRYSDLESNQPLMREVEDPRKKKKKRTPAELAAIQRRLARSSGGNSE